MYDSHQVKFIAKITHQRFHHDEGKAMQNDSVIIKIIAWLKIRELLTGWYLLPLQEAVWIGAVVHKSPFGAKYKNPSESEPWLA